MSANVTQETSHCSPVQHSQCSMVEPVNAIQAGHLALQSSSHQRRELPGGVSTWRGDSLLHQVTGGHVLSGARKNVEFLFHT